MSPQESANSMNPVFKAPDLLLEILSCYVAAPDLVYPDFLRSLGPSGKAPQYNKYLSASLLIAYEAASINTEDVP